MNHEQIRSGGDQFNSSSQGVGLIAPQHRNGKGVKVGRKGGAK